MTFATITTAASGILGAIVAVDHILARLSSYLPNSTGQFVWRLITRQPIKAQLKGANTMKFNFDTFLKNFSTVAAGAAQTYEAKQQEGKSLHSVDYINMGVTAIFAIVSAIETASAPAPAAPEASAPVVING